MVSDGFVQFGNGEPIPVTDIKIEYVRDPGPAASKFTNSRTIPGEVVRSELESGTHVPVALDGDAIGRLLES